MATYQVQRGDTLSGIASKNNTDINTLMSLNPNIIDPNKILSGSYLNLSAPQTQAGTTVYNSSNANDYAIQEAEKYRQTLAGLISEQQTADQTSLKAIELKKQQAAGNLEAGKVGVIETASKDARQAYINKILGGKTLGQELSQAGLNTTGTVGTAFGNLENSYGENVNNINTNKATSLNNIDRSISDSNNQYDITSLQTTSEQEKTLLALKQYIEEQVYGRYNDAYTKKTEEEERKESLRQYYENLSREIRQQQFDNDLALKQLAATIAKNTNNSTPEFDSPNTQSNIQSSYIPATSYNNTPKISNKVTNPLNTISIREAVNFNNALGLWNK